MQKTVRYLILPCYVIFLSVSSNFGVEGENPNLLGGVLTLLIWWQFTGPNASNVFADKSYQWCLITLTLSVLF